MKKRNLLVLSAVVVGLLVAPHPAQAATYRIALPGAYFAALSDVFAGPFAPAPTKCSQTYASSALNGVDSLVVNIASRANTTMKIQWSADKTLAEHTGGGLIANFYNASCQSVGSTQGSGLVSSQWTVSVPLGAKWMLITNNSLFNVVLNF